MGGGMLSQDEINALLTQGDDSAEAETSVQAVPVEENNSSSLDLSNIKRIGEIYNDTLKNVLNTVLGKDIEIKVKSVEELDFSELKNRLAGTNLLLETSFTQGFLGAFYIYVDSVLGGVIADLMTGADGSEPPESLTELHESAVNEAVNQVIASGLTTIANESPASDLATDIPKIKVVEVDDSYDEPDLSQKKLVLIQYSCDLLEYKEKFISFIFPVETVENINSAYSANEIEAAGSVQESSPEPQSPASSVSVSQDSSLKETNQLNSNKNMMLLLDVPTKLSVTLGKAKLLMRDILNLGIGSIIELDSTASEPVDLTISHKPVARGEVVVVDENFGLRLTELVSTYERLEITKKCQ
jgi:flagellar motor switch protein FliN/FliY